MKFNDDSDLCWGHAMPELDVNYIRSTTSAFWGGLPQSFKLTVTSFLTQKLPGDPCGHLEANDILLM